MPYATNGPAKYYELLDGVRYAKVSPKNLHAFVQLHFGALLIPLVQNRGRMGPEWEFRVGAVDGTDTILQPDLSIVTNERYERLDAKERGIPPWSPDVAIEIRSPSSRPGLRTKKTERYLTTGAVLVLDVDPATRSIRAHAIDGIREFAATDRFEHPAMPWLVFDVCDIFAGLDED